MREILFYFDYVSPYSYLAWRELRQRAIAVRPIPVVFAAMLEAGGQLGPAEIPAKRSFLIRDCLRRAAELRITFAFPPRHPFRSLDALRASIDRPPEVIDRLFAAAWEHGRDLSDRAVIAEALAPLPLPEGDAVKSALRKLTDDAIARGVFGVPTFEVGGEIVWGSDRLKDALAIAEGHDAVDRERAARFEATPVGIVRGQPPRLDPAIEARVRAVCDRAPFLRWLGVKIESIALGTVTTTLEVRPEHLQQDGFLHAGVTTTLADHTAGAAAATHAERPLTVELKINLLRPVKGPHLRCRATVLRAGRTLTVAESEVFDGATRVAKALVTLSVAAPADPADPADPVDPV